MRIVDLRSMKSFFSESPKLRATLFLTADSGSRLAKKARTWLLPVMGASCMAGKRTIEIHPAIPSNVYHIDMKMTDPC